MMKQVAGAALACLIVAMPAYGQAKRTIPDSVHRAHHPADSTFAALQARGRTAMGVDQATSTHAFDILADGGRIALERNVDDDPEGVAAIRAHLRQIAETFRAGDFQTPLFVHAEEVPGTRVMAAKKASIDYAFRPLPRGGEVRLTTRDPEALEAIRAFMMFQRTDHRAGGTGG